MRFEFSWDAAENDQLGRFRTSCPKIGEVFMRSQGDLPKLPDQVRNDFFRIFGGEPGKFEALLSQKERTSPANEIITGIRGLCIRVSSSLD